MKALKWLPLAAAVLLVVAGCKKRPTPEELGAQASASASAATPPPPVVQLTDEEVDKLDLPTRQDFETEVEKEILPNNLESELDTLEKEIRSDR